MKKQPAARPKLSPLERKWQKWWLGLDASVRDLLAEPLGFTTEPTPKKLARLATRSKLELYEAGLADLAPLAALTNLAKLDLYGNGITDVAPLAKLKKLTDLRLGNNADLDDLAPLARLPKLKHLDVSSTAISDLAPLARVKSLRYLLVEGLDHIDDLDEQLEALAKKLPKCDISKAE